MIFEKDEVECLDCCWTGLVEQLIWSDDKKEFTLCPSCDSSETVEADE